MVKSNTEPKNLKPKSTDSKMSKRAKELYKHILEKNYKSNLVPRDELIPETGILNASLEYCIREINNQMGTEYELVDTLNGDSFIEMTNKKLDSIALPITQVVELVLAYIDKNDYPNWQEIEQMVTNWGYSLKEVKPYLTIDKTIFSTIKVANMHKNKQGSFFNHKSVIEMATKDVLPDLLPVELLQKVFKVSEKTVRNVLRDTYYFTSYDKSSLTVSILPVRESKYKTYISKLVKKWVSHLSKNDRGTLIAIMNEDSSQTRPDKVPTALYLLNRQPINTSYPHTDVEQMDLETKSSPVEAINYYVASVVSNLLYEELKSDTSYGKSEYDSLQLTKYVNISIKNDLYETHLDNKKNSK